MTPSAGEALHPDTVGYAVRRLGQAEVALFIDAAWPHLAAWAAPSLTPDELHALAPMLLVMAHVKDPRWLLRNQGGAGGYRLTSTDEGWVAGSRARTASDARRLPLPPPTHAGMTANEAHAAKLTELGYPDAARALWAALMAQRGSGS